MTDFKYVIFMVGLPGVGKSTWIKKNVFNDNMVVVSTDDLIEDVAKSMDMTYNEIFEDNIEWATKVFFETIQINISMKKSIVIDRTNLTVKSRKKILDMIPKDYKKIAVLINCSDDLVLYNRLNSRKGKIIPYNVIENMKNTFVIPSLEEGFNDISIFDTAPIGE